MVSPNPPAEEPQAIFIPPLPQPQLMEKSPGSTRRQSEPRARRTMLLDRRLHACAPASATLPGVGPQSAVRSVRRSCFSCFYIWCGALRSYFLSDGSVELSIVRYSDHDTILAPGSILARIPDRLSQWGPDYLLITANRQTHGVGMPHCFICSTLLLLYLTKSGAATKRCLTLFTGGHGCTAQATILNGVVDGGFSTTPVPAFWPMKRQA